MIRKLLIIILLLIIYFVVKEYLSPLPNISAESTLTTGLILIAAYLFALVINRWSFPKLTGYMILGLIIGPAGLNFLNHEILENLKFLDNLALSFIALTAGGELKYNQIKKYKKIILSMLSGQIVLVFVGLSILIILSAKYIPFLANQSNNIIFGLGILFAATAISTSPAVTIGIITELKARGKLTDIVLSVTMLKSIVLVLLFPVIIMWAKLYLVDGAQFSYQLIYNLLIEIIGSIGIGFFLGFLAIWYLKYVKVERSIFLLGLAIVITEISFMLNLQILLIAISTGIIVENFSKQGEALIHGIENSSLPLYIIFFCFAGAGLHIETLKSALSLTIFLVIIRMALKYVGNYLGAYFASEDSLIKNLSWMGFIGQAGIALGLGTIIENTIPGSLGTQFKTILISSVVINEFLGPILFRYLLIKSKEASSSN